MSFASALCSGKGPREATTAIMVQKRIGDVSYITDIDMFGFKTGK